MNYINYKEKYTKYKNKREHLENLIGVDDVNNISQTGGKFTTKSSMTKQDVNNLDRILGITCSKHLKKDIIDDLNALRKFNDKSVQNHIAKLNKSIKNKSPAYEIYAIISDIHKKFPALANYERVIISNLRKNLIRCCKDDDGYLSDACTKTKPSKK